MFALVLLLLLESSRFIENNLALLRSTVHADGAPGHRAFLLDLLDNFLEFSRADTVLPHHIVNPVAIVVLFGFLGVERVCFRSTVKKDVAALVAG